MRRLSDIICNQDPLTLPPSATVKEACERMRERRVGAVLVTDQTGRLVGIFTGRDAVCRVLAAGRSASRTRLREVMTERPTTMAPGLSAIDALRTMWDGGFRHVPICDGERLAGIVSRGDFRGDEQERLDEECELWERVR